MSDYVFLESVDLETFQDEIYIVHRGELKLKALDVRKIPLTYVVTRPDSGMRHYKLFALYRFVPAFELAIIKINHFGLHEVHEADSTTCQLAMLRSYYSCVWKSSQTFLKDL